MIAVVTLFSWTTTFANNVDDPKFYETNSNNFLGQIISAAFGNTLDPTQLKLYHASMHRAVLDAENGQRVTWYHNDASGYAQPVYTRPRSDGYCRRVHIQVFAYGVERLFQQTACYSNASRDWQWYKE